MTGKGHEGQTEDVRTEDTGGWDDPRDMKARRCRDRMSAGNIPYRGSSLPEKGWMGQELCLELVKAQRIENFHTRVGSGVLSFLCPL